MRNWVMTLSLQIVSLPALAMAQERPWEGRGWGMHPGWWMWGPAGAVMMLVFWALVITGLVLGIRWLARQGHRERPDRALDILRERYARGEIDKDEFLERKRDL